MHHRAGSLRPSVLCVPRVRYSGGRRSYKLVSALQEESELLAYASRQRAGGLCRGPTDVVRAQRLSRVRRWYFYRGLLLVCFRLEAHSTHHPPPHATLTGSPPSIRTHAFFPSKGRNEADHGMLGTANNEASASALYKKAAAPR